MFCPGIVVGLFQICGARGEWPRDRVGGSLTPATPEHSCYTRCVLHVNTLHRDHISTTHRCIHIHTRLTGVTLLLVNINTVCRSLTLQQVLNRAFSHQGYSYRTAVSDENKGITYIKREPNNNILNVHIQQSLKL